MQLPITRAALPAMTQPAIDFVCRMESVIAEYPQADLQTEHVLHAGLYARTIRMPVDTVLTGALIKLDTVVIVNGDVLVYTGENTVRLTGYHVLPAGAGRKQAFIALADTTITMLFPTQAQTVEEAEAEFTDEADRLLSRKD